MPFIGERAVRNLILIVPNVLNSKRNYFKATRTQKVTRVLLVIGILRPLLSLGTSIKTWRWGA